jgi:protease I
VTSVGAIRDDLLNAGADWVDEAVVVDGNLVSSRRPPDLPQYARAFVQLLAGR